MSAGPLGELADLARGHATGEFIAAASAAEVHVYLQRGRIAWATSSAHPLEFARHIKAHCAIDDETFRRVLEDCRRERLPVGEALVSWGLVSRDQIRAALANQVGLAFVTLSELPRARTLFLQRPRFTEYDADLTLALEDVPGAPAPRRTPSPRRTPGPGAPRGLAAQIYETVEGAAWVEILEGAQRLQSAPDVPDAPRVSAPVVAATVADGATFVALRSAVSSVLGVALVGEDAGPTPRSAWCALTAESNYGAAVSALAALTAGQTPPSIAPRVPPRPYAWSAVPGARVEAELQVVMDRAREVDLALVRAPSGAITGGLGREGADVERAMALVERRRRLFEAPLPREVGPHGDGDPDALGYTLRSAVAGDPERWCFGLQLDPAGTTLWLLLDRALSQGLGWSCLSAMARGLARLSTGDAA